MDGFTVFDFLVNRDQQFALVRNFGTYRTAWIPVVLVEVKDAAKMDVRRLQQSKQFGHQVRNFELIVDRMKKVSNTIGEDDRCLWSPVCNQFQDHHSCGSV